MRRASNAVAVTYPLLLQVNLNILDLVLLLCLVQQFSTLIFRLTFVVTRSPSYRSVIFRKHEMS